MVDLQAPPAVDRLQKGALAAGAFGLLLCALGWFTNAGQFYKSWLFAFLFWIGLAIGCLSITLIHNLTGGMWGLVIRRLLEAGARTLPWFALLFVPIAIGLPHIYVWAQPEVVATDLILQKKALYLNAPFFLLRAAFYFAVWFVLGHFQTKWARAVDEGPSYLKASRRLRGLGGAGLLLMGPHHHLLGRRLGDVAQPALVLDGLRRALHGRPGALRDGVHHRVPGAPGRGAAAVARAGQGAGARPGQADARLRHALGVHQLHPVPHHLVGQPAGRGAVLHPAACTGAGSTSRSRS
jgi:hypothetical protein